MKIALILPLAVILAAAVPQSATLAQPYQGPSITIPLPGAGPAPQYRDDHERHCAELENREHELHERMEHAGYSDDREHLADRLRETHEHLRDECGR